MYGSDGSLGVLFAALVHHLLRQSGNILERPKSVQHVSTTLNNKTILPCCPHAVKNCIWKLELSGLAVPAPADHSTILFNAFLGVCHGNLLICQKNKSVGGGETPCLVLIDGNLRKLVDGKSVDKDINWLS